MQPEPVSLILFSTSSFKINDTEPSGIIDFKRKKTSIDFISREDKKKINPLFFFLLKINDTEPSGIIDFNV